jgi:hypothetical protein
MRYFVVMEVKPDLHSNGFVPVSACRGDNWISRSNVITEEDLKQKLEIVRTSAEINLDNFVNNIPIPSETIR